MRKAKRIISTYAADTSGAVSALYELGGLSVIHDASGCGSTYTTHDEPRWYDMPSMVAITALTEIDAVMGNDRKIVGDILSAMELHRPRFVSITSTPVPYIMGTDLDAVAKEVERQSGVPSWYCPSNGMHPYTETVSSGLISYLSRFVPKRKRNPRFSVNLVGVTPLDFISQKRVDAIVAYLEDSGIPVCSVLAMGCGIEGVARSSEASLDLVVSSSGLPVARFMEAEYGIPWIVGLPYGKRASEILGTALKTGMPVPVVPASGKKTIAVIGEGVQNSSILSNCPDFAHLSITPVGKVAEGDIEMEGEEEIASCLKEVDYVIADPLYRPIVPETARFIPFPHFAFSGRLAKDDGVEPVGEGLDHILEEIK
jgi:nitrogenase molybdenum-cofactor synthesis protein NifE